jgi:antitoxin component of MazEF toxin-antitoxin module
LGLVLGYPHEAMATRLTPTGERLAVILDQRLLEQLDIDAETELEISTDGRAIVITPVRADTRTRKLEQVVRAAHEQYADVFRRLAE